MRSLVGSAANVSKVFQGEDRGASWVNFAQFREALDRRGAGLPPRACMELFTGLDRTGDGSVQLSELRDWASGEAMPARADVLAVVRRLISKQLGSAEAAFDWMFAEVVGTPREQQAKRSIRGRGPGGSKRGSAAVTSARTRRRQDTARGSRPAEKKPADREQKRRPLDPSTLPALSANSFVTAVHRLFSTLSDRSIMPTQADAIVLFQRAGKKTIFCSHFISIYMIILPRQARDRREESSKKRPFSRRWQDSRRGCQRRRQDQSTA